MNSEIDKTYMNKCNTSINYQLIRTPLTHFESDTTGVHGRPRVSFPIYALAIIYSGCYTLFSTASNTSSFIKLSLLYMSLSMLAGCHNQPGRRSQGKCRGNSIGSNDNRPFVCFFVFRCLSERELL